MNRRWILPILAAAAAGILAFGAARLAVCRQPDKPLTSLQDATHLAESLGLSPAQAAAIRALHSDLGAKLDDCCRRHCAARERLGQTLAAGTNGAAQAEALLAEMSRAYEESERATLGQIRSVRAVLNAEQQKRFDAMLLDCMCRACDMQGGLRPGAKKHD